MSVSRYANYDNAEDRLKAFTRSAIRTRIMLCLRGNALVISELEGLMGVRASTILHAIKEMIEEGLIVKNSQRYSLSNIGIIQVSIIDQLIDSITVMDDHRDFWLDHDISGIPKTLLTQIGMLGQCEIIKGDPEDPFKQNRILMNEIQHADRISLITPIIIPGYPQLLSEMAWEGKEVDVILTNSLLYRISSGSGLSGMLKDLLNLDEFRLYVVEGPLRVKLAATESLMRLGLVRHDGHYDLNTDFICKGEEGLRWGEALFRHYLAISSPVTHL
ncbi:MAG: hypothetical protein A4E45_00140 [Methanosaeta sp. PtaB.Bin039]|nr:MAG: hypothetical protein A4E45_00140 [Methanosaeta sp. PtaB.Bin039]HOT07538.1 DUF1724 domain-containing protein [Methanotrichaceae archaeon]HQI53789.1 DUF1724 domain-containing protein [Methanothrix soehngenii]HQF16436.1 DUF1724 domain-containing protein [Methanotrichaceae archaeon]HQI91194.1 DUF1724 domain-containing protein [Methanotrichaceae archaeon]